MIGEFFDNIKKSISRSWSLMKKSYQVLMLDKELMVFPLVAGFFGLLAFLTFVIPLAISESISEILFYIMFFGFYLVSYFITIFFNTALIGAANIRLNGGDPTVKDGIDIALKRIMPILGWTVVAATVGLILNALSRKTRNNLIGRLVVSILGGAWSIITFFVIPVIAIEGLGPIAAVKKSTNVVKEKFGEAILGNVGFGIIQGIAMVLIIIVGIALMFGAGAILGPIAAGGVILLVILVLVLFSIFVSALNSIFVAALYNYATTGKDPENWHLGEVMDEVKKK